jgi:hypothetical protein
LLALQATDDGGGHPKPSRAVPPAICVGAWGPPRTTQLSVPATSPSPTAKPAAKSYKVRCSRLLEGLPSFPPVSPVGPKNLPR